MRTVMAVVRAGEHFADAFLEIGLHVAIHARIAVDRFRDLVERFIVRRRRIDADPVFAEIHADHFVHDEGLADVGAEVADAGDRTQLLAGLDRDAVHFRPRHAGFGEPVHEEVAFFEGGQQFRPSCGHHLASVGDFSESADAEDHGAGQPMTPTV